MRKKMMLTTKPKALDMTPGTHRMESKPSPANYPLAHSSIHMFTHKINKQKQSKAE